MNKLLAVFFMIAILPCAASAQEIFLDKLTKGTTSQTHNFYEKIYDDQGNYASIPVSIIKGKNTGPVFTIVSGVHGFEYPPIIAAQELIQEIDPTLLSGTIVIVPMANPNSFYSRTPFLNPKDKLNLNRTFPGNKNGSITERIADYITTTIIASTEVFLDIHGGDANEDLLPFICYYDNQSQPKQTQQVKLLTEASGFEYIVSYPYTLKDDQVAKYAFKQAVQDGKVALSIEAGKLGNVQKEAVNLIKDGVYNMLAEMKMYTAKQIQNGPAIKLNNQAYIRSEYKGIFESDYRAGDQVTKGAVVGSVKDEFGNVLSEITAPTSGVILYKIGTPPVNTDETLMCIGYTS